MENSEFDKYIRSHTEKDLTPPVDLNWENMNIPLPSEKKKDRAIYFYFIGFLILASGLYLFLNQNTATEDNLVQSSIIPENNTSLSSKIPVNKRVETEKEYTSERIEKEKKEIDNLNTIQSKKKPPQKTSSNQLSISNNKVEIQQDVFKQYFENKTTATTQPIVPNSTFTSTIQKVDSKQVNDVPRKNQIINKLSAPSAISSFAITFLPFTKETQSVDIPLRWETINFKRESGNNRLAIQLGFGLNTFQSNFNSSNQTELLQNADGVALGHSLNLKLKYDFKNEIYTSLGFTYQKLHNTFSYREDLGIVNNLVDYTKTHLTKVIYHNNYFENVALNIGVGKTFFITKNLGFDVSIQLSPTIRINSEGRILNDELQLVYIEDLQPVKKLFWSAGSGIDVFYKIKKNRIFAGAGFAKTISKVNLIQDSNLSHQPQIFTFNIGLGRRF